MSETVSRRLPLSTRRVTWVALGVAVVVAALFVALTAAPQQSSVQARSPLIGKPAPGATGAVIDGSGQANLAALGGKWVLVNFFASWCQPCQQELPELKALQAGRAGTVFGIEYDPGDAGDARSYLAAQHVPWPVVSDADADVAWGVHGIPESYLVSPAGTVVAKYTGGVRAADVTAEIHALGGAAA